MTFCDDLVRLHNRSNENLKINNSKFFPRIIREIKFEITKKSVKFFSMNDSRKI